MSLLLLLCSDGSGNLVKDQEVVGVDGHPQSPCPQPDGIRNGRGAIAGLLLIFYPVWATWSTAEESLLQPSTEGISRGRFTARGQNRVFVQDLGQETHQTRPVWMGGYDAAQKGMWLWSDGSAVDHFYWEEDEPSNSGQGENCMELHTGAGQGWNDVSCGELRFYVCSMETRSGLAALPSQKQAHERELVEEVSIYDVLC
ncbi:hypothetical protein J4Q44_G00368800 [Coregonus suidteri]|uniref:C-type lectin domain-containing protein n=1 Tax=Coregonus suidteri TaxID=861788 RepID=A0AAN8QA99_9TELE